MLKTLTLVCAVVVVGCGGGKAADHSGTSGANPCGGNPCGNPCGANPCAGNPCGGNPCGGSAQQAADFSDWQSFTKMSNARSFSKSHSKAWVEVYADSSAESAFRARQGPYPVGARIVKAQYAAESGGAIKALTVMQKMEAGYDPDNGDWYYGVYDPSGAKAMKHGKIGMCINCHNQASEQDHVFAQTK